MASTEKVNPTEGSQMKHFIPLESNPDVFNTLIGHLGASKRLTFTDVASLDEPHLHPLALILVFPTPADYEVRRATEHEEYGERGSSGDDDILWLKQTINNACGLYAILHALANGEARHMIGSSI
jgi:ubiquitin carboxyl-terminal hydrolase L3